MACRPWVVALGLLALVAAGTRAVAHEPPGRSRGRAPIERQAIYRNAPRFALVTQEGERLGIDDLRGRVVLVNFLYTTCPDVCPLATAKFRRVQELVRVRGLERQVVLVSITTDSAVDTPPVLKAYGQRVGADFSSWVFLTGPVEALRQAWEAFGVVSVARAPGDIDHPSMTVLLDQAGRFRLIYLGHGWNEEDVAADMVRLLDRGEPPLIGRPVGATPVGSVRADRIRSGPRSPSRPAVDSP